MNDTDALDFLAGKLGGPTGVAAALSTAQRRVTVQRVHNWRKRGISSEMRPVVWAMVNDHGGHLSRDWLMPKTPDQHGVAA
jgi:hypothetical protein